MAPFFSILELEADPGLVGAIIEALKGDDVAEAEEQVMVPTLIVLMVQVMVECINLETF